MKLLAIILSCLILAHSSGANGAISPSLESDAAQEECCGCCCECGHAQNGDADKENAPHHGCPFCVSQTCPGFASVFAASVPAIPPESHADECVFIQHKYISPSADGIWQPPRTA